MVDKVGLSCHSAQRAGSRAHFFRVARLQNEVGTKDLFVRGTTFLTKNAPKCSPMFLSLYFRNLEKGALEKGYLHKIVRNWLSNFRQICDNFAHPSSGVWNEICATLRKLGAQFATNLRNAPFMNAPFSGFLIILWVRKKSRKLPAELPDKCFYQNKKSPTSVCRSAGRTLFISWLARWVHCVSVL